jgi:hypothetical protein
LSLLHWLLSVLSADFFDTLDWMIFLLLLLPLAFGARVIDFEADVGGVADDDSLETAWKNGGLINKTLAELLPGDTLVFPASTYHVMGGIRAPVGLEDVTIQLDGTLEFSDDIDEWPKVRGE